MCSQPIRQSAISTACQQMFGESTTYKLINEEDPFGILLYILLNLVSKKKLAPITGICRVGHFLYLKKIENCIQVKDKEI